MCFRCYFFFQAEDGIRDAQESRGLGDVYRRQVVDQVERGRRTDPPDQARPRGPPAVQPGCDDVGTVSYTHLTLPTIYPV